MTRKEKSSVNNWGDCKEWGSWSNYPGHPMKKLTPFPSADLTVQKMIEEALMRYCNPFYGLSLPTNHPFYHLTLPNNMEKKMKREKFWMVLGVGAPVFRHSTKQSAKTEAERLAKLNPGQEFVVLESLAFVKTPSVIWESSGTEFVNQDHPF